MTGPRIGGLFEGYGGLTMGVQSVLGGQVAWHSEVEPAACAILKHHWPDVPNLGDITAIDWSNVEPVDVLTGGFPCQDLSFAGRRAGMVKGSRSNLWHEFVRAIAHLRPSVVVIENVRGLLTGSAEFDEPNDTCICGWPYRRRGLHLDPEEQGGCLPPSGDRRHDRESPRGLDGNAGEVRRADQSGAASYGEMGCGVCMDGGWCICDNPAAGRTAAPAVEVRAGAHCPVGGADQGGVADTVGEAWQQSPRMVGGSQGKMCGSKAEDARAELEGAGSPATDLITSWRVFHCEACGRDLGDGSRRSVQRSWMGLILGELARLGFDAEWHSLRAADVGAPHGRFRVFVVATDASGGRRDRWTQAPLRQPIGGATAARGRVDVASDADVAGSQGRESARRRDLLDRGVAGDTPGHGRDEERPEPARLVGRSHAAVGGDAATDTDRDGQQGVRGVNAERCDADGCGSPDGAWGPYQPAVRRWEQVLGRVAPAPTEPGAKGNQRLSPAFVEWLMGLPAGHVTGPAIGISRNAQLKALGNGVVPAQAAEAIRVCLARTEQERAA